MRHGYTRRRCLMFATSTHKYTLALWQIWLRCRARANGRSCCQEGKEGGTTAAEMCVCKKRSSRKKQKNDGGAMASQIQFVSFTTKCKYNNNEQETSCCIKRVRENGNRSAPSFSFESRRNPRWTARFHWTKCVLLLWRWRHRRK